MNLNHHAHSGSTNNGNHHPGKRPKVSVVRVTSYSRHLNKRKPPGLVAFECILLYHQHATVLRCTALVPFKNADPTLPSIHTSHLVERLARSSLDALLSICT
jgi:hypothetical protein